jgi:pimeloyl-ACP methyl ester carboxylesterase
MSIIESLATWIDTIGPRLRLRSALTSDRFNSRPDVRYASFPECIVRYRVSGNGPRTLVLATDPPVTVEQYDRLIGLLENDFRVVVFEIPGFGFSLPRSGFCFDFIKLNDVVARFLQRLDFGPYILAFPCVAAYGAIDIAERFPNLVSHLVLIQAPSWAEQIKWKHGRDRSGVLSRPLAGQVVLQALKRKSAPRWFDAAVGNRDMLADFVETTDRALRAGACFCLASAFQRYLTDTPPRLAAIEQPSLIFWGEADKSHRRTDKASSRMYCPDAEEVFVAHAGHFPELEQPELFAQKIRQWLGNLGCRRFY